METYLTLKLRSMIILRNLKTKINYKFGFYFITFFLLFLVTVFNYIYNDIKANSELINYRKEKILNSLSYTQSIIGNLFPIETVSNIITGESSKTQFEDFTILILLSNSGCNPCQVRELKLLQKLKNRFGNNLSFKAIYAGDSELDALRMRKVTEVDFDFFVYMGSKPSLIKDNKHFPLITVIAEQRIVYSYLPIPDNEDFSLWSIAHIEQLINNIEES